ncbi:MAG: hypothetical protein P8078_09820 [bacterium]
MTWNYDYQFELTFSQYRNKSDLSSFKHQLHLRSKFDNDYDYQSDKFGFYKLNGTTGLYSNNDFDQYFYANNLNVYFNKQFVEKIVRAFTVATYSEYTYPGLSFAWEEENKTKTIELAAKDTESTKVLIVIGYSFPFFNRDIDKKIIGNMKNLKKVYFQAPDAEILKERFQAIRDDIDDKSLVVKKDVNQFLIPNEL